MICQNVTAKAEYGNSNSSASSTQTHNCNITYGGLKARDVAAYTTNVISMTVSPVAPPSTPRQPVV